jgi:hypothetical protein
MTATNEDRDNLPVRLKAPALSMLLGFVAIYGVVTSGMLAVDTFWGPRGASASFALAINLLIVGTIWGLSWLKPSIPRTAALLVLLAFAAVLPFGATAEILTQLRARNFLGLWHWKTLLLLAANVLVFAGAIWGLWRLKPLSVFKRSREPVSPATRRTRLLFGLSGVVSILALVALALGTDGHDGKSAVWSNRQDVSPGFAVVAIVIWLLSIAIAWWWYASADEHERRANDVGFLAGGGLFMAATPVWWILARAGLAPPPDAMILWYATVVVMGIGWWWYRRR